ncbi:MAG: ferredoxin reductase [Bowdeniella nasicola]|nr:ferredoxin reductase [Bowdeniella nasicola]
MSSRPLRPEPPAPARGLARRLRSGAYKLASALATPLVPDDYLDLVNPLRAGGPLRARVMSRRADTARTATLTLRASADWAGHLPGQYVRIGVDIDGVRRWRAYSITSPPHERDFTITVTTVDAGLVSTHLVHGDVLGTIVVLEQATGDFTVPDPPPEKVLLITGGSGITPVLGMLRAGAFTDSETVLLHSVSEASDLIATEEFAAWKEAGRFDYRVRITRTDGHLKLADLDDVVPDWRDRHTWACGPAGLLDDCEGHWQMEGLEERLHVERFRTQLAAVGEGGTVTFAAAERSLDVDGATPLLDAGEDAGILMPSGCRMGICFGCLAPLRHGSVRDLRDGTLTTGTDEDPVLVQTCVSAAAGACTIDL